MPNTQAIPLDQAATLLIAEVAESAIQMASAKGVHVSLDADEARTIFTRRIVRAIQAGETDMDRLRQLALLPTLTCN